MLLNFLYSVSLYGRNIGRTNMQLIWQMVKLLSFWNILLLNGGLIFR